MARVFISYAHEGEGRRWAKEVRQWMVEVDHKVFLDEDPRDGIQPGQKWKDELYERLSKWADMVVCVVTSDYLNSNWCHSEIAIAQSSKRELLPLRAEPGTRHQLLEELMEIDLTADRDAARDSLIRALEKIDAAKQADHADHAGAGVVKRFGSRERSVPCGRRDEAAELESLLRPTEHGSSTIVVSGPSGIGKTTLAEYVGWKVQDLFPGGAVHVNMNGDAQYPQTHIDATEIQRILLIYLCKKESREIRSADPRSVNSMYQMEMAELSAHRQWVLVLLDNVSDLEKFKELLLSDHLGHRVMLTTQDDNFLKENEVPGLKRLGPLKPLSGQYLFAVFERFVLTQHPDDQWSFEKHHKTKLTSLFGGLPEELTLIEGLLEGQRRIRPDELISRLDAPHLDKLTWSADTRPAKHVVRVLQLSWQLLKEAPDGLGKQATDLLLLLSINPCPNISTEAVAALADTTEKEVLELRDVLHKVRLLENQWEMHALCRRYVNELAVQELSIDYRDAAFGRLLSHYQQKATDHASEASWFLLRHNRPGPEPDLWDEPPTQSGRTKALEYFQTEHLNLLNCLRYATDRVAAVPESKLRAPLVALTAAMAGYLRNNGPWDAAEQAHEQATHLAESLGDLRAQAIAFNDLGITRRLRGNRPGAQEALDEAHRIFGKLSDTRTAMLGQANTLNEMGIVANDTGWDTGERRHHKDAIKVLAPAWDMYRLVGDIIGMANSAKNRGVALGRLDEFGEAIEWLERSLARYRQIDDILGEVEVRNHRSLLHLESEDPRLALNPKLTLEEFEEVLKLLLEHDIHSPLEEARAHDRIGIYWSRKYAVTEDKDEFTVATTFLTRAEVGYSGIGADRDRGEVAKKLADLKKLATSRRHGDT